MKPEADNARRVDLLLEAFRQGKPGAFDGIVRAHQDRIFSFCARMLSDREEALDVSQEVFISAYRNLENFREEAQLSTWLFRIAANRCLNRIRQRTARASRETRFPEPDNGDGNSGETRHPAPEEGSPSRIAENAELGEILSGALTRIDPDSRRILLLSDVEGFTNEEIATMLEIPIGTVKSRIHRARMALRKILAPVVF